jgi:formylglycine-generating enzyme required for sulfatase activity
VVPQQRRGAETKRLNGEARQSLHGGSWFGDDGLARSFVRHYYNPNVRSFNIGFRVLCPLREVL